MKKIYLTLIMACISLVGFSQYYVLPNVGAGMNPGGLNQDDEFPVGGGLDASWTTIMSQTTSPTWSSSQSLPFSFMVGGLSVSSYQVSSTGVVTFASSPGNAPTAANAALPSSSIPDLSICAWGLEINGSNDAVVSKTFGTSPNRQHWIFFTSASETNIGTGWTYWSIVLEESTDNIYIVDQRTATSTQSNVDLTVGLQIDGSTSYQVPASPNVGSFTSNAPDASDNTYYEFGPGTLPNRDIEGIETTNQAVVKTGAPVELKGIFRNLGGNTVTSADINYQINGGTTVTKPVTPTNPNLATGGRIEFKSTNAWTPSADGEYDVKLWIDNINGQPDQQNDNDTLNYKVQASTVVPERMVVIEEKTGSWCGWCPRGFVGMDYMDSAYHSSVIPIAVHNQDPMVDSEYDGNIGAVAPGGYPGSAVDRVLGPDPNPQDLENAYNERIDIIPSATVEFEGVFKDLSTNEVTVDVKSTFVTDLSNIDYRYAAVIIEDSVTGSAGGYAQVNYYSFQSQDLPLVGYGFDWQAEPNPLPASKMFYNDVARAIEPGFFGAQGSVPSSVKEGDEVTYQFKFNLPSSVQDVTQLEVAVLLLDNSTNEIINANKAKMDASTVGLEEDETLQSMRMYPNPASDYVQFAFNGKTTGELVITDLSGKEVQRLNFSEQKYFSVNTSNLPTGVYMVRISSAGETTSEKLVISQ